MRRPPRSRAARRRSAAGGRDRVDDARCPKPDTQFNAPRWSPDGRRIAVERHRLGRRSRRSSSSTPRRATFASSLAAPGTRIVTPAWRPDGRAIVAAAAPTDDDRSTCTSFRVDESGRRRAADAHRPAARRGPTSRPTARTIVFVGYTAGRIRSLHDAVSALARDRRDSDIARRLRTPPAPASRPAAIRPTAAATDASTRYSPLATLLPTSWTPRRRMRTATRFASALATGGSTCSAITRTTASATWLAAAPDDAPTPNARVAGLAACRYAYDRWRPTLFAAASSDTSFFAGPADATRRARRRPRYASARSRPASLVALPPRPDSAPRRSPPRAGRSTTTPWSTSEASSRRPHRRARRPGARNTAQTYGYSISPEDGITRRRDTRELVPRSARRRRPTPRPSPATRARICPAFGAASRARAPRGRRRVVGRSDVAGRTFLLGGAGPDAERPRLRPRARSACCAAFPPTAFAGSRVALLNADYRWPHRAPAARHRHVAALPAHASTPPSSPTPATRGRGAFDARDDQDVRRRRAVARRRRRLLLPVHRDGRRRVGTRRQRHDPRHGTIVPPNRTRLLAESF